MSAKLEAAARDTSSKPSLDAQARRHSEKSNV
jgi:hypothetical protein